MMATQVDTCGSGQAVSSALPRSRSSWVCEFDTKYVTVREKSVVSVISTTACSPAASPPMSVSTAARAAMANAPGSIVARAVGSVMSIVAVVEMTYGGA